MEATGHARWFERLLAELQFEPWIGDAAAIRTKRVLERRISTTGKPSKKLVGAPSGYVPEGIGQALSRSTLLIHRLCSYQRPARAWNSNWNSNGYSVAQVPVGNGKARH
jgi:hypothetical protein